MVVTPLTTGAARAATNDHSFRFPIREATPLRFTTFNATFTTLIDLTNLGGSRIQFVGRIPSTRTLARM